MREEIKRGEKVKTGERDLNLISQYLISHVSQSLCAGWQKAMPFFRPKEKVYIKANGEFLGGKRRVAVESRVPRSLGVGSPLFLSPNPVCFY